MELQMNFKRAEDAIIFPWLQQNLTPQRTVVDIGARKGHWLKRLHIIFLIRQHTYLNQHQTFMNG